MNKNYKLSYRVSVLITGSNSNINISFQGDNTIDFTMYVEINKIYFFNFIIISRDHSDPTKRIMSFTYEGITKSITVSNNIKIKFTAGIGTTIYASNYIVTIQDHYQKGH